MEFDVDETSLVNPTMCFFSRHGSIPCQPVDNPLRRDDSEISLLWCGPSQLPQLGVVFYIFGFHLVKMAEHG